MSYNNYNNHSGEAQDYYGGGQQQQGYGSGAPAHNQYGGPQQHDNQHGGPEQNQYGSEQRYGGPAQYDQGYGQQSHQQGYGQPQQPLTARDEYPSQTHGGYGANTSSYQGTESAPYAPTQPSYGGQPGVEGDRGMMGALAGGAAGAYGGHKMNHGILGAIGGAFAGSKLEDFGKEHHQKKEDEKYAQQNQGYGASGNYGRPNRRDSNSSSDSDDSKKRHKRHSRSRSRSHSRNRAGFQSSSERGNFSETSRDISIDYNTMALKAFCRRSDGSEHESYLPLNNILGNNGGEFVWSRGGNFMGSVKEGKVWIAESGRALCAVLGDGRGGYNEHASVQLDARISNRNGELVYLG